MRDASKLAVNTYEKQGRKEAHFRDLEWERKLAVDTYGKLSQQLSN